MEVLRRRKLIVGSGVVQEGFLEGMEFNRILKDRQEICQVERQRKVFRGVVVGDKMKVCKVQGDGVGGGLQYRELGFLREK